MKRNPFLIIIACCCFVLVTGTAFSQGLQLGYFLQPQLSSLENNSNDYNNSINNNQTATVLTGLTASYFFSKTIGLGTGLTYGHEGQKFVYQQLNNGLPVERSGHHYQLSVIKIPLTVKYHGRSNKIGWFIEGGPEFTYNVKMLDKTTSKGNINMTGDYSGLLIGFQIGTGIGIRVNKKLMAYIKPNIEITNYTFHYSTANLDTNYPLGHNFTSQVVGLQLGIIYEK